MLTVRFDFDFTSVALKLQDRIIAIVNEELEIAVSQLSNVSPVATGQLQQSWKVDRVVFSSNEFSGGITNDSDNWLKRMEGRRPGKQPPSTALEKWVQLKLGISDPRQLKQVSFLVARKIGKEGTLREKHEFDPITGFPVEGGIIDRAFIRIENRINLLRIA